MANTFKNPIENIPFIGKPLATIGDFGASIIQGTARSGGTMAMESYNALQRLIGGQEQQEVSLPKESIGGKAQRIIFGEEPLRTIKGEAEQISKSSEELGISKDISSKIGLPLAIASVGLDFTGFGGAEKQVIKRIINTKTLKEAKSLLIELKASDDVVSGYAKAIKMTKDEQGAKSLLQEIKNASKTKEVVTKTPKFLESVSKARPDINLKVGGQYIPRATDVLSTKAKNLILDNIDKAEEVAKGTDDNAIATASELIKHYGDEALSAKSQGIKNAMLDRASEIAHSTATKLVELGRSVQAASIIGRLTPEGQLRFAAREINKWNEAIDNGQTFFGLRKKIPQLSKEQTEYILKSGKEIQEMADGTEKAIKFKKLQDYITTLVPSSMYQKIAAVWKAGLLTGAKTSGLNTLSNLFHGASEVIKDVPAVAVDSVSSLFTGKRTIGLTTGSLSGVKEGFKKGFDYLKTGYDERNIGAKLDYNKVHFGTGKVAKAIQTYEESIFKFIGAQDQPFYYGAKSRSLISQAIAEASNRGLKGQKAKEFVEELVDNPTNKMLKTAVNDAEIAVFQNETMLGKIAKMLQSAPGGQFIVPFARTPAAVAMQFINYSPVGAAKTIYETFKSGKFDQRVFSQGIGRSLTGTAVMGIGAKLAEDGLVSTSYPESEREQKLWELEGRTENSIKIGGEWRKVNVLGPAGYSLLAGANYYNKLKETGSPYEALASTATGGLESLTDQTFLSGVNQLTSALSDPDKLGSFFSNTVSSIIPTAIGDVAKGIDQVERRSSGAIEKLQAKTPGLRGELEPKINVLGEEVKTGNFFEVLADPTRPSNVVDTPVINEFRRLKDLGFAVSPTLLGDKNGYNILTPEQNTELLERTGEITNSKLSNLLNLKEYKSLSDEDKAKTISKIISKSQLVARTQAVIELTQGLSGNELKSKLSELKSGGLMTKEVFNEYIELR